MSESTISWKNMQRKTNDMRQNNFIRASATFVKPQSSLMAPGLDLSKIFRVVVIYKQYNFKLWRLDLICFLSNNSCTPTLKLILTILILDFISRFLYL